MLSAMGEFGSEPMGGNTEDDEKEFVVILFADVLDGETFGRGNLFLATRWPIVVTKK